MNKIKSIVIMSLVFVAMISCNKELAIDVDPLYIASWEADDGEATYSLSIDIWGFAYYEKIKGAVTTEGNGRAKIKDGKLHIGLIKFTIDQAPGYNAQNELIMILDGVTYYAY